jgi:hypothetical protein
MNVAGKPTSSAGQSSAGQSSAGQSNAFGGSSSAGTGGAAPGGASSGGSSGNAGSSAGNGGKANGGSAGSGGMAGAAGVSGMGGTSGSGGGGSTGDCAPEDSGWVVQYWTSTPASNLPGGDFRVFNNAGGTVNFTALELRHYFTNEETATLSFIFSTFGHNFPGPPYHEDENGANVLSSVMKLEPAVMHASHYVSIKFNDKPGSIANGEHVQVGFYGSLAMYPVKSNQANDYTYIGHATSDPGSANKSSGWNKVTLYESGTLVWGCEP